MKNNHQKKYDKVVHIGKIRKEKESKDIITALLRDTRKSAFAIQHKTCLLCQIKKMCVSTTGLCASCYNTLSPKEKNIADREAQHKTVETKVTDDRWEDLQDS